ncbi:uncharacterized protein LOC134533764 [Bacillus rossius redtenbacheri]|uniref:uncharacterized protein LOC134533764 n=1 Tax=Bacillus rossius redtenbacheri TaxID=93214 RepID=UPI002FDEEF3F
MNSAPSRHQIRGDDINVHSGDHRTARHDPDESKSLPPDELTESVGSADHVEEKAVTSSPSADKHTHAGRDYPLARTGTSQPESPPAVLVERFDRATDDLIDSPLESGLSGDLEKSNDSRSGYIDTTVEKIGRDVFYPEVKKIHRFSSIPRIDALIKEESFLYSGHSSSKISVDYSETNNSTNNECNLLSSATSATPGCTTEENTDYTRTNNIGVETFNSLERENVYFEQESLGKDFYEGRALVKQEMIFIQPENIQDIKTSETSEREYINKEERVFQLRSVQNKCDLARVHKAEENATNSQKYSGENTNKYTTHCKEAPENNSLNLKTIASIHDVKSRSSCPVVFSKERENFPDTTISIAKCSSTPETPKLSLCENEERSSCGELSSDDKTKEKYCNIFIDTMVRESESKKAVNNDHIQIWENSKILRQTDDNITEKGQMDSNEKLNEVVSISPLHMTHEMPTTKYGDRHTEETICYVQENHGDTVSRPVNIVKNKVFNDSVCALTKEGSAVRNFEISQTIHFPETTTIQEDLQEYANPIINKASRNNNIVEVSSWSPIRQKHATIEIQNILDQDSYRELRNLPTRGKAHSATETALPSVSWKPRQAKESSESDIQNLRKITLPIGTFQGVSLTRCAMAGDVSRDPAWEQHRRQYCLMMEMIAVNARPVDPVGLYFLQKEIRKYMGVPKQAECNQNSQPSIFSTFRRWLRRLFCGK